MTALVTTNPNERVSMGAFRYPFSVLTNLVAAIVVLPMVRVFGGGAAGWRTTAIIFAVLEIIGSVVAVLSVKELSSEELKKHPGEEKKESENLPFWKLLKMIVTNKYYLIMLALQFLVTIFSAFASAGGVFFYKWQMKNEDLFGYMSAVSMLMLIGIIVTPALVKRLGMYKVNVASYVLVTAFSVGVLVAGYSRNVVWLFIFSALKSICMGPVTSSINALVAEVATYTRHKEGVSIEGSIYSCTSVGTKVGGGLGTAIIGWLLNIGHYDGLLEVQPDSAIAMINVSNLVLPLICAALILLCVWKLDVEKKNKEFEQQ